MVDRMQPQKSFGAEMLELRVSDRHFLMKVSGLVDWAARSLRADAVRAPGKPAARAGLLQDAASGAEI